MDLVTQAPASDPPKAIPPRPRMSEEEYAALTVLNDEELLTIYALKSGQVSPPGPVLSLIP